MPNFYAHLDFGKKVLEQLDEPLRQELQSEECSNAYLLGQYGPDPLFFYKPYRFNQTRTQGFLLHRRPMYELLPRLRRAVDSGDPRARGYAAGFLCHYALDSKCHHYVVSNCGVSGAGHTTMEVEFDRFMAEKDGLHAGGEVPMLAEVLPADFFKCIHDRFYPDIEEDGYRGGLSLFERTSRWHGEAAEKRTVPLALGLAARRFERARILENMFIIRPQGGVYDEHDRNLLQIFESQVEPAASHLEEFFRGEVDPSWYCMNLHGESFPMPDLSAFDAAGDTILESGEEPEKDAQPDSSESEEEEHGVRRLYHRAEKVVVDAAMNRYPGDPETGESEKEESEKAETKKEEEE